MTPVIAKPYKAPAGDGLQPAKDYAEILGLKFAYATNGREIQIYRELPEPPYTPEEKQHVAAREYRHIWRQGASSGL